jgi:uncharacterized protein (TIGR00369 family)
MSRVATNFDIHVPFVEHLGLQLLQKADGRSLIQFDPRPEHLNSWQGVHGGVLLAVLDVALSSAARSLDPACIGATTVEMKTNFLAVATGAILIEGRAQRAGRSLIFAEGEVRDADGTLLAKASGTFKLLYHKGTES